MTILREKTSYYSLSVITASERLFRFNGILNKPTSTQVGKPTKYTTHPQPSTIKALKRFAFDHELQDYEVVEAVILAFLKSYKE